MLYNVTCQQIIGPHIGIIFNDHTSYVINVGDKSQAVA